MANLLDKFNTRVVGSSGRIVDVGPNISSDGDFQYLTDLNVITTSWGNLLQTPRRTYIDDPEYGSDLLKMVFAPADAVTIEAIKTEVKNRIMQYDSRASIGDIQVTFLPNKKGFVINISVSYKGQTQDLSVAIKQS